MTRALHLVGMHGLGDCIHQRALVQALLDLGREVWLETPWPSVYWEKRGLQRGSLQLIHKRSALRTQAKNAARQRADFDAGRPPRGCEQRQVSYAPAAVRSEGSVLAAMLQPFGFDVDRHGDFRLGVPVAWRDQVAEIVAAAAGRPILVLRPLNERKEWSGCTARNPHFDHWRRLFATIRDDFFVVSVGDFERGKEWHVGPRLAADREYHEGQLVFEALAALVRAAALTFAAPGFLTILAQAVGTPSVTVYGGYEDARTFSAGGRLTPWLPIEPIVPVCDFKHDTVHDKSIDVAAAIPRLQEFARAAADRPLAA